MQSATERDDFVRIAFEHIQEGTANNFNKYDANTISNFGELYDVTSVMHYGAYGFTKNGYATIVPNVSALSLSKNKIIDFFIYFFRIFH